MCSREGDVKPIGELTQAQWQSLRGIATDLDDTLTLHGALTVRSLEALYRLSLAKIHCIVATGRASGWGAGLLQLLPVSAVVTENGGAVSWRDGAKIETRYTVEGDALSAGMSRVHEVVRTLRHTWPELGPAVEGCSRVTDTVLDVGESFVVDRAVVDAAVSSARRAGLYAVASTVHLHVSARPPDKSEGVRLALKCLGIPEQSFAQDWVYIGDSPNDTFGFRAAAVSIGIRGIERFAHELDPGPQWVTNGSAGEGFAEVVDGLLKARQ